jgi:hypothetical protein
MANPASHTDAARIAEGLLTHAQPGARHTSVKQHRAQASTITETIWRRWQVGPWQWQLKHVLWYLDVAIHAAAPSTRYHHWRTLRVLLHALMKPHWIRLLEHRQGPTSNFLRPDGKPGALHATRGRPAKFPGKARKYQVNP